MMSYIHHKEQKTAILGMQGKLWKKYEEDLRGSGENRKSWERTPGFKHIQQSCPRVNHSQQCLNPEWSTENNESNQKQSVKSS